MVSGCPLVKAKIQPQIAEAKIISIVLCVDEKKKNVESECLNYVTPIHFNTHTHTHQYTHIHTHIHKEG